MLPQHLDVVPQPMGEYEPVDRWQAHVNALFHALRGHQAQEYFQTFASSDYRLAHALAVDYFEHVRARAKKEGDDHNQKHALVVHEWGCGHGNLAACFLGHLQDLDKAGDIYPRLTYVLVDMREEALSAALAHPDLAPIMLGCRPFAVRWRTWRRYRPDQSIELSVMNSGPNFQPSWWPKTRETSRRSRFGRI